MSMSMPSTTRIADLPENITMQIPNQLSNNVSNHGSNQGYNHGYNHGSNQGSSQNTTYRSDEFNNRSQGVVSTGPKNTSNMDQGIGANTYMPMNIHPNPYGPQTPTAGGEMPFPQNVHLNQDMGQGMGQGMGQDMNQGMGQGMRLPSRDIPMDSTSYMQDEEIQPNYIPKPSSPTDYIKEYEAAGHKKLMKHEEEKHRMALADDLFSQLQTPIFVSIMYFIFQMPIFNRLLYKYGSTLPIFRSDGNMNLYGMILKSGAFGLVYYFMDQIVDYVSHL